MSLQIPKSSAEVKTQYEENSDTNAFTDAEKTLLGNQSGSNSGDQSSFPTTFSLPGDISPAQLTASQNNYNPTDLATASTLRLTSDASRDITGLQGGADGRVLLIHNVGSSDIVLKDSSSSSDAANRFALTADFTMSADSVGLLQYDSTSLRWRLIGGGSSSGGAGLWEEDGANVKLSTVKHVDFQKYKAIAMVCDNGATLPGTPTAGQWYLHTPTGRNVLMMHDGSNWIPIVNIGAATIYVDGASGTDSLDNGGASGSSAFDTVQYAVDSIAGMVGGDVIINVASGTYAEAVIIQGKVFTGNYTITLVGNLNEERSETTVSSATAGSRTANGTMTINAASMTTDAYKGMILKFEDDTATTALQGLKYIIKTNDNATNSVIEVVGGWVAGFGTTPSSSDTFTIVKSNSIISGTVTLRNAQIGIVFDKMQLRHATPATRCVDVLGRSRCHLSDCDIGSIKFTESAGTAIRCHCKSASTRRIFLLASALDMQDSLIDGTGGIAGNIGIDVAGVSSFTNNNAGTLVVENCIKGVLGRTNSTGAMYSSGSYTKAQIENNTTGLDTLGGAQFDYMGTTYVMFTGNSTDTTADAATFAIIQ